MMPTWVAIGVGGALGSLARHSINVVVARVWGRSVPGATFSVNVIGCLLVGWLAGLVSSGKWPMPPTLRSFLFVGVLGGFTTFSSFGLDTLTLLQEGTTGTAAANVLGQVTLGLLAVALGYRLGL